MKYLIVAVKNTNYGGYDAVIYNETDLLFNLMVEKTENLPTATPNNVGEQTCRIIFDDNEYENDTNGVRWVVRRYIGFRKCDVCGDWITPQDVRNGVSTWDGDIRKCKLCVAKDQDKSLPLHDYHETRRQVRVINGHGENFDLSNVLGIGIEVEYYNGGSNRSSIKCSEAFYNLAKDGSNQVFRLERDCTVTGEIISNVFTKKSLYDFDMKILTDVLLLNGNIEGNDNAGLHAHLSKSWLGTDPKEQCLNFLKLQYFMKSYEEDFLKMSGRKREYMEYCQFFSYGEIEDMKYNIQHSSDPWDYMPCDHGGGVGCALNNSGATIEYRIGKNTNDPERMKHYLRFLLGIVENIKNVPFSKCYCIRKVTRLVPEDTMNYWRKHGCFLRTNAIDERGVTL